MYVRHLISLFVHLFKSCVKWIYMHLFYRRIAELMYLLINYVYVSMYLFVVLLFLHPECSGTGRQQSLIINDIVNYIYSYIINEIYYILHIWQKYPLHSYHLMLSYFKMCRLFLPLSIILVVGKVEIH